MVYLCGRPLRNRGRCTLGRETAIQPMVWGADGWLRTIDGDGAADRSSAGAARCRAHRFPPAPAREEFDDATAADRRSSGCARRGRRSCSASRRDQDTCGSTAARRSAASSARRSSRDASNRTRYSASTVVDVEPQHFQQTAGLICYYNSAKFHYLYVSHDEAIGKHLRVMSCAARSGAVGRVHAARSPFPPDRPVHLRVEVDCERLQFAYRAGRR